MSKIRPLKRLGQNFLVDKKVVKKIIKAANLKSTDTILEIGPGLGSLTKELTKNAKMVIAVEKDPRLVEILKENLKEFQNVEIVRGDILKLNFQFSISNFQSIFNDLISKQYKVVANLPFYITAPVIRKFLGAKLQPKEMVLVIQKEVAQRICAKPPNMNLLAVSVQFYAKPEIIDYISKKSFWPQPKVDAAIIKIVPHKKYEELSSSFLISSFFKIVKTGFSHPRKQLANNLSKELKLNKKELSSLLLENHIQPTQRAETLIIDDWLKLTNMLK